MTDYVGRNRAFWDGRAHDFMRAGERNWSSEPNWGIWDVSETQLGVLPVDMTGLDAIELGCGTAYISAWLARRGARPVGVDNSPEQLATARRLQAEHGLAFPLHLGNAEATSFPDASFDFAISEYGASNWCDPYRWIPEAARLLRPGGQLVFLCTSNLLMLAMPEPEDQAATAQLQRPQRGIHRFEWPESSGVEFNLSHGDWIRLLRRSGFDLEDLVEVYPPAGATSRYSFVDLSWASAWPSEELWRARKRS